MLVLDASVIIAAALGEGPRPWSRLLRHDSDLATPHVGRSEAISVLHEKAWRREITATQARETLRIVLDAPVALVEIVDPMRIWHLADSFGWAKTYDAEYVALTQQVNGALVTIDLALLRRVGDLVSVVNMTDLS